MAQRNDPIAEMIEQLATCDYGTRGKGERALKKLKAANFSEQIGMRLLTAAAHVPLCPDMIWPDHAMEELIRAVWDNPAAAYAPVIEEHFGFYSSKARTCALAVLAEIPADAGLPTFLNLINRYKFDPELTFFPRTLDALAESPAAARLPFAEAFLTLPDGKLKSGLQSLLLAQTTKGWLHPDQAAPLNAHLMERLHARLADLRPFQQESGIAWMYTDGYAPLRSDAGEIIDLISHLCLPESRPILSAALGVRDQWIKLFALIGLLKIGERIPPSSIEAVARHAETRGHLFDRLGELGMLDLFPLEFKTQASLAEADLVAWLTFPTELNSAPDEIELMQTEPHQDDPDKEKYYFRFRTFEPHWAAKDGWMEGWAGPFPKNGPLQTHGTETFSQFASLDGHGDERQLQ